MYSKRATVILTPINRIIWFVKSVCFGSRHYLNVMKIIDVYLWQHWQIPWCKNQSKKGMWYVVCLLRASVKIERNQRAVMFVPMGDFEVLGDSRHNGPFWWMWACGSSTENALQFWACAQLCKSLLFVYCLKSPNCHQRSQLNASLGI